MKITLFSNYLNHHQLPFCQQMCDKLGIDNFHFVATTPFNQKRLELGYHDMNEDYDFCVCSYKSDKDYDDAMRLGYESDVVILGSAPDAFIKKRMKENKLTFHYSERIFKEGYLRAADPRVVKFMVLTHTICRRKNSFMLCSSAYTACDMQLFRAYPNKMFKWGYFPATIDYDVDTLLNKKRSTKTELLWCARYLDWKHPEKAIRVAKVMKNSGYQFNLNMIGTGELEEQIKKSIKQEQLDDCVHILGSMSPERVREYMEKANIFLFTSDYNEGWGAVLNESMNSACAVVASHAIGSVPFLIKNGYNGLVYKNDDDDSLYQQVKKFMDDKMFCKTIGINAYNTIKDTWNAAHAAKSLINLCHDLLEDKPSKIAEGPCSVAVPIRQNDMYEYIVENSK